MLNKKYNFTIMAGSHFNKNFYKKLYAKRYTHVYIHSHIHTLALKKSDFLPYC